MKVFWLVQSERDLPEDNDWLATEERVRLRSMSVAKRQADWRLGRWTAKSAVLAAWSHVVGAGEPPDVHSLAIRAAPDGAPEAYVADARVALTISISHSACQGLAAVAAGRGAMGCDIEEVAERSRRFVDDYFTERERATVHAHEGAARALATTLIWSAKESTLKALREGLRLDTRAVEIELAGDLLQDAGRLGGTGEEWRPLHARLSAGRAFHGLWQTHDKFVLTVVAETEPEVSRCGQEGDPPI